MLPVTSGCRKRKPLGPAKKSMAQDVDCYRDLGIRNFSGDIAMHLH